MTQVDRVPEAQEKNLWEQFSAQEKLSEQTTYQFKRYAQLLREWNERTNLTRITDLADIITYHFQDSMRVRHCIDLSVCKGICDVGAGAGFPGVPLSILYPEVPVVLLEVNQKKVSFLRAIIAELGLKNCTVCDLDWRTFLRKAPYPIDLFVARASLQPEELVRVFGAASAYKKAQLIYWASQHWEPVGKEAAYLIKKEPYTLEDHTRYFAFFAQLAL
ncbi:16S rRNA (guanine(527)-N(7))-methyltransferase RsmG [Methylicorpusculum sp.]|uniref:16S rRNA (guanine(527)-N(7))-methyltransferase RsmG n=1 Tax=Methylicorpusculum sp. TaxID=2713644 RepID=UPI002AB9E318|nr:16S rRNA (guanine(527)-N(7))-methyltransferase RsmG [Methylicorpusculum sp.]MDZ4152946.1 16S rRNA (guanine(527)-N(7))-methyltransferase RsmG [Methylicorpusculum sp.]